jgi:hypothetical protein
MLVWRGPSSKAISISLVHSSSATFCSVSSGRPIERELILLSEFSNTSDQHKVLYEFVEKSGIALALAIRLQYNKFVILSGRNADLQDFRWFSLGSG